MISFKPENVHTVIPRIFTDDVAGLVDFLRIVFGADGELRSEAPTENENRGFACDDQ